MKITIQTTADFTPKGKRSARVVEVSGHMGRGQQLRWYVGGHLYRRLSPIAANVNLTNEWLAAQA